MILIRFIGGVVLLGLNAFFVSIEFAMTRLRQFDEEEFQDNPSLRLAWSMTKELELYLTACQVGITITSILLGVVFEPAVTYVVRASLTALGAEVLTASAETMHLVSIVFSVALIQLAHTVWGEQTPTYLGVEDPKLVAQYFAPPLYAWGYISYPLIFIGDMLAKGTLALFGVELTRSWTQSEPSKDIRKEIGDLLHDSHLDAEEQQEIVNAVDAAKNTVRSVVIPRTNVVSIETDQPPHKALETMRKHRQYTRFPLVDGDLTNCVGILYAAQVLGEFEDMEADQEDLTALAAPVFFLDANTTINEAIDQFQDAKQEMAVVVDRDQKKAIGVVTDSHLFEAVFGELEDPFD